MPDSREGGRQREVDQGTHVPGTIWVSSLTRLRARPVRIGFNLNHATRPVPVVLRARREEYGRSLNAICKAAGTHAIAENGRTPPPFQPGVSVDLLDST